MKEVSAEQVERADVDAEARRLMAWSNRDLVMKDIPSAVNAFQEVSSLLGMKYSGMEDQYADAVYYYGMALLELARMENNVLGDPLEQMPEEEDKESHKDSNIPSASKLDEKEKEELRVQVYDAMSEKDEKADELEWEKSSDSAEPKEEAKGESAEVEKDTAEAEDSETPAKPEETTAEEKEEHEN
ncbi:histone-binding protein N1/N2-like [Bufo gargarizans]|uniref:histone-binding protein N1/N2-like n=1 Tax=Bufo gargarizans TaxID=30331 RepID=UPI001CF0F272|nr:histone-binding protein N1/N2-like [Bufo gargarizans]